MSARNLFQIFLVLVYDSQLARLEIRLRIVSNAGSSSLCEPG